MGTVQWGSPGGLVTMPQTALFGANGAREINPETPSSAPTSQNPSP
jgi:hypothetical protein